jgi:gas vesicle protein
MRHKEFWIALGLGAMAGGVAALLYAPQSGEKTRKQLRRGVEDLGESLEESAEYLKSQADRLGKEAQKLLDASKQHFDVAMDDVMKSANKAAKTVSKLV